jgi:molecular chaperone DnaK
MSKIVGIDLGTTNSAIAIMDGDEVKVIPSRDGDHTIPSIVAFIGKLDPKLSETTILVGRVAKNQAAGNPQRTIASAKRLIGRRVAEIPEASKKVSYGLAGRPQDPVQILLGQGMDAVGLMPQKISAEVLKEIKKYAEDYLGETISEAVITVPAYFNDGQRQATKHAGAMAGLNVRRIINEPTAAALAYGITDTEREQKIAVFDLGGGTFDISVLEVGKGVWEVQSTNGDTFLGGDDFDREIINLLARNYLNQTGVDLREHPSAMQRLKEAAEKAKHELSSQLETSIQVNFLAEGLSDSLEFSLTREKFESLLDKYLKRIETCCKQALKDAKLAANQIDEVVLVGGSTRVPAVRDLVMKVFGKEPNTSVNPDEVVALGAAIQGAILSGDKKGMVLVDVTPLSLGIEAEDDLMEVLIPRNTQIPCVEKDIFTTTDDDQTEVDVFVYQGEHRRTTRNRMIGQFILDEIEPTYAGEPQIEVRFAIDADGILQVSAKNAATGSEQQIIIKDSSSINPEDLSRMMDVSDDDDDFDDYDDDDDDEEMTLEEMIQIGEGLLVDTNNGLQEFGDVLDHAVIEVIKATKQDLAEALDSEDEDLIEAAIEAMLLLWEKVEASVE